MNFISIFIRLNEGLNDEVKKYINIKTKSNNMGLKELFKKTIEKEVSKRDKIIAKKEKDLLKKDEDLLKKDEDLLKKDEETVCRSFKNGISIPLIVNITNLQSKEVKNILKKAKLI